MGIRQFNLRRSQVRKMGKYVLKLSRRENSMICSRVDSSVKVWSFSNVSGTDFVPIFRVRDQSLKRYRTDTPWYSSLPEKIMLKMEKIRLNQSLIYNDLRQRAQRTCFSSFVNGWLASILLAVKRMVLNFFCLYTTQIIVWKILLFFICPSSTQWQKKNFS